MADAETPPVAPPVAQDPKPAAPAAAPLVDSTPETFTALVDLQYGTKLVKAGDTTNDVPKNSVKWLLEQKFIEKKEVT